VLDTLNRDLAGVTEIPGNWKQQNLSVLPFSDKIELCDVSFSFPASEVPVISGLNLVISKYTSIGFVGATGSGKTTLVDIILGLLTPQYGNIKIDNVSITASNVINWQNNLGYVPQSIFLSDDSLANNIAFGVPSEQIDMAAVEHAARIANLHDFIINDLPGGYSANVGERGVRLSGGQRQRIGIARALYRNPEVLIMDEATSALDGLTEEAVIQAIRSLAGKKTIITIAHRLATLKDCDQIYVIDKGKVVEHGSYEDLKSFSSKFKAMDNSVASVC
jgi:ABC-type multidrug transport system fused ATPase/permease subunit